METTPGILRAAAVTDVGLRRQVNQDDVHVDLERQLFIVADGMGGHKAGDLASRTAVEEIGNCLAGEDRTPAESAGTIDGLEREIRQLLLALQAANRRICALADERREYLGMGTTIVVVRVLGERFIVAHAGDSRLYRLRQGQLDVLTKDHSRVQELIDMARLTQEEAEHYPGRNVITRALGGDLDLQADTAVHELDPRDILLLCTDGLSAVVPAETIRQLLIACAGDPQQSCDQLIAAAKQYGAPDNVTVAVLEGAAVSPGDAAAANDDPPPECTPAPGEPPPPAAAEPSPGSADGGHPPLPGARRWRSRLRRFFSVR
jgi:PPM family protein phosphatase